ncbi:outer membrane protein assembly factor BamB family protein [Streptomyces sp. DSM 110735]|uniref:outer membrane protein assembly factor BamB family protein n=1 Tax=Streptomyces sp. DSM 110735 TaxID=2775031 RepID=UPI0018F31EB9|nr:PQQ-binding-like beta-propeller repeat protein [Streptomyces sp. DSM 110735]MBJ7907529.1 PQQ-binding-like beta-propeller repeat protein [Streptomyces sp. DSM 110735]
MTSPPPSAYTASTLAVDHQRRRRRTRLLLGGVAAVVVACLALWAWSGTGGSHDDDRPPAAAPQAPDAVSRTVETPPRSVEGRAAVRYREEIRQVGATADAPGAWATDKTFAKGFVNTIRGFTLTKENATDAKGDRPAWTLTFPGPLCATTRHVSAAGWTAVAYAGEHVDPGQSLGAPCDRLAVVDLDTGRKRWETRLGTADAPAGNVNVTMTDGAVVVAGDQGSAAYDTTHGKRLWTRSDRGTCTDTGFAGGSALLALARCGDSAAPRFHVERVDARTGRTTWTYRVGEGIKTVYLASADPAVIAVAAGDVEVSHLIALDEHGRARGTIRLADTHTPTGCDRPFSAVVESCRSVVVGARALYVPVDDDIVAFDLATGKSGRRFASSTGAMTPLKMSGDRLIAYREGSGFTPSAVVSLDPGTGKERPLLLFGANPDDLSGTDDPTRDDVLYEHGRLFFGATSVYGPTDKGHRGELSNVAVGVESVAR